MGMEGFPEDGLGDFIAKLRGQGESVECFVVRLISMPKLLCNVSEQLVYVVDSTRSHGGV